MLSPLSGNMMNILNTNLARWELICSQENRPVMAESVVSQASSSSSSGGGSIMGESRRESLDPPPSHHRLSRSSAEGDDDSDPCTSYPYMPLEALTFSRRHSLPMADSLFSLTLPERRRSLLPTAETTAASRRRIFARTVMESMSSRDDSSPPSSLTDEDFGNNNGGGSGGPRVTFHLTRTSESGSDDFDLDIDQCNRFVAQMQQNLNKTAVGLNANHHHHHRRGSAPCNLLINQINATKLATAAAVAAAAARDAENDDEAGLRRGSLPADLLTVQLPPPAVVRSRPATAHGGNKIKAAKARKMVRRRQSLDKMPPPPANAGRSSSLGGVGSNLNHATSTTNGCFPCQTTAAVDTTSLPLRTNEHKLLFNPVQIWRNNLLSPSVEAEVIECMAGGGGGGHHRRGSLPIDLSVN